MFIFENYNFIFGVISIGIVIFFFYNLYQGKDKINLKYISELNDNMSYSSDERMFLRYSNFPFLKKHVPKKDSYEYKRTESFLLSSKKQKYRTVHIFYGAKYYYALLGFLLGFIIGFLPVGFNIIIDVLKLELVKINFPIILSIIPPFAGLFLYKYPDSLITQENAKKKKQLQKEILSLGIVIHSMLETGSNPYEILEIVKEIKPEFKEDIEKTLNEYYIDTARALTNLKKRINIVDFDMIADSLLYAHESDNTYATSFLNDYLIRLEQAQKVIFEKSSKIRPYFLLGASTLPMIGALIVWFYPWLAEATKMLSSGFGI